jgi:hypothetical protein
MEKTTLAKALGMAGRFVSPRSPLDNYKRVWLRAADGGVTLSSANNNGMFEVFIPCNEQVNACVDFATLYGLVKNVSADEVGLVSSGNTLDIYTGTGVARVPDYEMPPPDLMVSPNVGVVVLSDDFRRCVKGLRCLVDGNETHYSQSQSISSKDGIIRFTSNTSRAWGCTWCPYVSDAEEIDAMIPIISILAASDCLEGDQVSMDSYRGVVSMVSGNVSMVLPTEASGRRHRTYEQASQLWESAPRWHIDRSALREFLAQVSVFATPEATGMWMKPTPDGVLCQYTGRSDGTHAIDMSVNGYCEAMLPGTCESESAIYVSSKWLSTVVDSAGDEGFLVRTTNSGIFVLSEGFAMGVGLMEPPQE